MTKIEWLAIAQQLIEDTDFNSVEYFLTECEAMGYTIKFIKVNSKNLYVYITDTANRTIDGTLNYAVTIAGKCIQYFDMDMTHEAALKKARGHAVTYHMIQKADPADIAILKSFTSLSGTNNAKK